MSRQRDYVLTSDIEGGDMDHKKKAQEALARVGEFGATERSDWPLTNATLAVAEATLYAAEQQRIANLIARIGVLTHLNEGEVLNDEGVALVQRLVAELAEVGLA